MGQRLFGELRPDIMVEDRDRAAVLKARRFPPGLEHLVRRFARLRHHPATKTISRAPTRAAAGLPLGEATMGGRAATVDGVLQPPYRAMAVGSAVVLVLAARIVLGRAGTVPIFLGGQALVWSAWVVTAIMVLNTVTNLSGRHPLERLGMSAIALATSLLVGYVAYAAP